MVKELIRVSHIKTIADDSVKKFNMDVYTGESMLLLGNCDSGKERVRDIITGRNGEYEGTIFLHEKKADKYKEFQARKIHGIFYANVNETLVPTMSIAENLYIIRDGKQGLLLPKKVVNVQTEKVLKEVDIYLSPSQKIYNLDYLSKLKICIAKAVTYDSKLIVFECSSHQLSCMELKELKKILNKYKKKQISFLIISEKPDEILELADRVTVIKNGIDKKVLKTSGLSRRDLLIYMFGTEFSVDPLKSKGLICPIPALLYNSSGKTAEIHNIHGPLGIFDTQWSSYENAMDYIQDFFEKNKLTLFINNKSMDMKKFSPSNVYQNGIVFIDEKCHDHLFTNFDLKGNLLIPRNTRELFSIIHNRMEDFAEREFFERFYFLKNNHNFSETLLHKLISIFRWERYNPRLMILDSPAGNLGITEIGVLQKYLQSLVESGIAVILMCRQLIDQQPLCGEIICAINKDFKGIYQADSIGKDYTFFLDDK